jgi:hypothetical protein
MRQLVCANHYSHSIPSGETIFTQYEDAIILFSRPANKNISKWLLGKDNSVWELSRMWAPDGHRRNLLTQAIAVCTQEFSRVVQRQGSSCDAIVSYADPNVGHDGTIYRAASWQYLGQSEEGRYYIGADGQVVARRKFHAGDRFLKKHEIEALGYAELLKPGKHRFAKGLSRMARRQIALAGKLFASRAGIEQ